MKNLLYTMLSVMMVSLNVSCKKGFLEVADKTVLLKEAYVIDLETTNHYLNGIYLGIASKYADGFTLTIPEFSADNIRTNTFNDPGYGFGPIAYWKQTPELSGVMWSTLYGYIRDCSFVIEKAANYETQNPARAKDIMGQALAIRAWMHFILVNAYAQSYNYTPAASHPGIPYIVISDIEPKVSRQTVAEVYKGIIKDLNQSLELLPASATTKEKISRNATLALLARAYLFKGEYMSAINYARAVMKNVPLMTGGYPENLYTPAESEAIFQISNKATPTSYFYPNIVFYAKVLDAYYATGDIATLLKADPADKRSNWVVLQDGKWLINKFPAMSNDPSTGNPNYGDYFQTLLRSSEMALTAAESYAQLQQQESARFYLDAIRLRANPALAQSTLSGPALLEAIYTERRKEMCFDGLRMFDLLRWKRGVSRSDPNYPTAKTLLYPSDKAIFPIPKEDVEVGGLEQNAGY